MPDDLVERLERHAEYTSCDPEIARAAAAEITRLRAALSERAAADRRTANLLPMLTALHEALQDAGKDYGEPGSRDVEVSAWNDRIDHALLSLAPVIRLLAAAPSPPAGEAPTTTPEGQP